MDPLLRALKVFVVVAGVVLVIGIGAFLWLLAERSGETGTPTAAPPETTPRPAAEARPVVADLPVPPGANLVDLRLDGERVLLFLRAPDEQEYLVLANAATGERLSLVRLVRTRP